MIRYLGFLLLIPMIGCTSMMPGWAKSDKSTEKTGQPKELATPERTITKPIPPVTKVNPEDITIDNYDRQMQALQDELERDRRSIGIMSANAFRESSQRQQ